MKQGVEKWLCDVETSMQKTIAKMINYAVSSFPKQSLDEWILSHETGDLLEDLGALCQRPASQSSDDEEDVLSRPNESLQKTRTPNSAASSAKHKTFSKISSKRNVSQDEEEDQAMKEYLRKKNELKAA